MPTCAEMAVLYPERWKATVCEFVEGICKWCGSKKSMDFSQVSLVPISFCRPPHVVTHPDKADELTQMFKRAGWDLAESVLVGYYSSNGCTQLLSGSHRYEAAVRSGMRLLPVIRRSAEEVSEAWGDLERWQKLMSF